MPAISTTPNFEETMRPPPPKRKRTSFDSRNIAPLLADAVADGLGTPTLSQPMAQQSQTLPESGPEHERWDNIRLFNIDPRLLERASLPSNVGSPSNAPMPTTAGREHLHGGSTNFGGSSSALTLRPNSGAGFQDGDLDFLDSVNDNDPFLSYPEEDQHDEDSNIRQQG
jgi:hypothetical protein